MSGFGPTGLREVAREEAAGLKRALTLLRAEARSFPGPEGSSAFSAAIRAVERELSRVERTGGSR